MVRVLAAGITLVTVMSASALSIGTAQAKRIDPDTNVFCQSYQHIAVEKHGVQYIVRNDNYGGKAECLSNHDGAPNFAVVRSGARVRHYEPVAYPNIFLGCSWGICTKDSGLPKQASKVKQFRTTWHTTMPSAGTWGAGYDIWFDRTPVSSGQSGGAELMIWLNAKGFGKNTWPTVKIDGTLWHLAHWVAKGQHKHWNYIQFRRVNSTSKVTNLNVKPFIAAAERHGLINSSWWLTSVEAGFEIWRGGVGLGTTQFMVHV